MERREIEIRNAQAALSVSEDTLGEAAPGPALLFVPVNGQAWQVVLTPEGAQDLLSWLQGWLKGR